jgi:hypothetical protein
MRVVLAARGRDVTRREFAEKTTGGSPLSLEPPPAAAATRCWRFVPDTPREEIAEDLLSQTAFNTAREIKRE